MAEEQPKRIVCSFCDKDAEDVIGTVFARPGGATICTDCILVCLECLVQRGNMVMFKPTAAREPRGVEGSREGSGE